MLFEEDINGNDFLFNMLNSLSEMIFIFDSDRKIKYVNDTVKKFVEKNREEIVVESAHGEILNCSFFLKDKGCGYGPFCSNCFIRDSIEKALNGKEPLKDREGIITLNRNGRTEKIYVVINAVPFKSSWQEYVALTMRDITKIKEYEEERIRELEKLSVIGAAASSIVHDLKNPLTGIAGYLYLLENKSVTKENSHIFSKIEGGLRRIRNMLEEILTIASGRENIEIFTEEVNYEEFIDSFLKEINTSSNIEKNVRFKNSIKIDRDKISHVLWNIIKNADEAMQGSERNSIIIDIYLRGNRVITKISDFGSGIPEDIQEKLFKPGRSFGKKTGKGFGLFGVKRIIEAHGGEIYFQSKVGEGTIFFIELPLIDEQ